MSGSAGAVTSNTAIVPPGFKLRKPSELSAQKGILVPVAATSNYKAVAINPVLSKLTSEVLAAVDRAVAGTTIEPIAAQRVYAEERLRASREATNLTPEEKSKAADNISKQIAELDIKLGSFKGTEAYNLFISGFGKYGLK